MINPMVFYWVRVFEGLNVVLMSSTALAGIGVLLCGIIAYALDEEDAIKPFKILFVIFIISAILLIFVPDDKTLIRMVIMENATGDNIEQATQFVIEAIKKFKE